jgi:hypothetical protein
LPDRAEADKLRVVEKKRKLPLARIHAYAEKLRFLPHLSDDERYLYAWSLAATPQERWERHENFLRSYGLYTRSERKKFGFSS